MNEATPISHQASAPLDMERIERFCRKWMIQEFSLFGSVLRDDFHDGSDVDVLVDFRDDAPWSLWDLPAMREELRNLFGREVDLVSKRALKNPFRRHNILNTRRIIYAA